MEDLADLDAEGNELRPRRFDVVDDEIARILRPLAEMDRGRRARWRELNSARAVGAQKVGIEPPAELLIELFGAVDVGDGNDDGFELQVSCRNFRGFGGNGHGLLLDVW
jgi:hypothetical protein